MRIDSTDEVHLSIFGLSLLGANLRFIVMSAIGALVPSCLVILDGRIVFLFF